MDNVVRAEYQRLRNERENINTSVSLLVEWAKRRAENVSRATTENREEPGTDSGDTWEYAGFGFALELEPDTDMGLGGQWDDCFGSFGEYPTSPLSIKVNPEDAPWEWRSRYNSEELQSEYRYYNPPKHGENKLDRFSAWQRSLGMGKHDLFNYLKSIERSTYQRHMDWVNDRWYFVSFCVICSAEDGTELSRAYLGGLESDVDRDYALETVLELEAEALGDAKAELRNLCAKYGGLVGVDYA